MSSDDDGNLIQNRGIFRTLLSIFFGTDKKVAPEEVKVVGKDEDEEADGIHSAEKETVVDTLDLQSMTHLYRKQLVSGILKKIEIAPFLQFYASTQKLPVDRAFRDAADRRQIAERLLAECDEEVLSADAILKMHIRSTKGIAFSDNQASPGDSFDDDGSHHSYIESGDFIREAVGETGAIEDENSYDEAGAGEEGYGLGNENLAAERRLEQNEDIEVVK
jgi:hypothetical protein